MKKILLLSIISLVSVIGARHYDDMLAIEKIAYTIAHLPKETINQPADLSRQWFNLKADKLELAAQEAAKAVRMSEASDKEVWQKYINLSKQLAETMRSLPARQYKKSFEFYPQWMALKARHMETLSKQLQTIADQVKNDELAEVLEHQAKKLARKSMKIKRAIELSKSSSLKMDFDENDDYEKPYRVGDRYRMRRDARHAQRDLEDMHGRLKVRDGLYQSRMAM